MTAVLRLALILLVLINLPAQPRAAAFEAGGHGRPIVAVVTLNQYFGADLTPVLTAPPDETNAALLEMLASIAATNFPARAERQARLIARQRPDLIGLQEVVAFGCTDTDPPPPGEGCSHPLMAGVVIDFLDVTLDALAAAGADYRAVAVVDNLDTRGLVITLDDGSQLPLPGLPIVIDGRQVFLTALDRDVILAREATVRQAAPVTFPEELCRRSRDGCNYATVLPFVFEVPGGAFDLTFERGFVAVDAELRGHGYRFVTTHLEVEQPAPFFQAAQAAELIALLAATTPATHQLIVAGDINSSPEDEPIDGDPALPPPFDQVIVPPYQQFVAAAFTDVWTLRFRPDPGFTCCQAPDLLNELSLLDERIDIVFTGDAPLRATARTFGDRPTDKTGSGLWPSDHAGVAARLLLWPGPEMLTAGR